MFTWFDPPVVVHNSPSAPCPLHIWCCCSLSSSHSRWPGTWSPGYQILLFWSCLTWFSEVLHSLVSQMTMHPVNNDVVPNYQELSLFTLSRSSLNLLLVVTGGGLNSSNWVCSAPLSCLSLSNWCSVNLFFLLSTVGAPWPGRPNILILENSLASSLSL